MLGMRRKSSALMLKHYSCLAGRGLSKQRVRLLGSLLYSTHPTSIGTIDSKKNKAPPLFLEHSKWNIDSYGLSATLIDEQTLQTIRHLPEVEDVLVSPPLDASGKQSATEKLRRAVEVFQGMNPGGKEHMACLAMLAETTGVAGSMESDVILDEILSIQSPPTEATANILIAQAKSAYYKGEFALARTMSEEILDVYATGQPFGTVAAARTILGASRLQEMKSIDDAFSVRDPFRMIVKHLERSQPSNKLAMATAHLNLGTAEAIYAQAVSKFNDVSVPLDSALRSWKQGSAIIASRKSCSVLKARCLTNISWGLIQMSNETGNTDYLEQASEYAQSALRCYQDTAVQDGLGRTLCSLAVCAHMSGQPVTAQGLFASAMDQEKDTVVGKLNFIETLRCYANLLEDWEKRGNEAKAMKEKISSVSIPVGWGDKSVVSGSMWLFGLGLFC